MALYKKLQTIKTRLGLSNRQLGKLFGYSPVHIAYILTNKIKSIKHYSGKSFDMEHLEEIENIILFSLSQENIDLMPRDKRLIVKAISEKNYYGLSQLLRVFSYLSFTRKKETKPPK